MSPSRTNPLSDPFLRALRTRVDMWVATGDPSDGMEDGDPAVFYAGMISGWELALHFAISHPERVPALLRRIEQFGPADMDPIERHAQTAGDMETLALAAEEADLRERLQGNQGGRPN